MTDRAERTRKQYADDSKLNARIALHRRFSSSPLSWYRWVFDQMGLTDGMRVLELGGGNGLFWHENRDRLPRMALVFSDPSSGMLASAKHWLDGIPNVEFRQMHAAEIPDQASSFDIVIANHMLYEVPDLAAVLTGVGHVVRNNGHFFAATNGMNHMRELDALVNKPLETLAISTTGFSLENGGELLGPFFQAIQLRRHDNPLAVTDASAVVAYVHSLSLNLTDRELDRIGRAVRRAIEQNGAFSITRDSGMFVCSEPRSEALRNALAIGPR